jgi:hypothetical protein
MRFFILILIFTTSIYSQNIKITHRDIDDIRIAAVPGIIKLKVDSAIIARTGNKLYNKYFRFDSSKSGLYPGNKDYLQLNTTEYAYYLGFPHYDVIYFFVIPQKPWEKVALTWHLDSLGNFIKDHFPDQLPDCISDTSNCLFEIDSLEAIKIAKDNGIPLAKIPKVSAELSYIKFAGESRITWVVNSNVYNNHLTLYYVDINTGKVVFKRN